MGVVSTEQEEQSMCVLCGAPTTGTYLCDSCNRKRLVPCRDCADRSPGCHSTCERYAAYKEASDTYKQIVHEGKMYENYKPLHWKSKKSR